MVKGSILTSSSDFAFSSGTPDKIMTWDTETKLGAGAFDYHTTGGDLVLPVDGAATHYEIFMYLQNVSDIGNHDAYMGIRTGPAGSNWYGIVRSVGRYARGYRSGLRPYVAADTFSAQFRTFSGSGSISAARSSLGILVDPVPLATATAYSQSGTTIQSPASVLIPTVAYDPYNVYDGGTGDFIAPAGTEACVASLNFASTPFDGADCFVSVRVNGVTERSYMHLDSGRSPGPGTFGIFSVSPGDAISFWASKLNSRTWDNIGCSVEFY